jgi:hypothetical protein
MLKYKKDTERFFNDHNNYDNVVVDYGKSFVKRIKTNKILKDYLETNNINIYSFLSELMPMAQNKYTILGKETLDENEINQIFGTIIISDELLKLLLKGEVTITGINKYNEFIYELSDAAILYFDMKYRIKLSKSFSLRHILIMNSDNTTNEKPPK